MSILVRLFVLCTMTFLACTTNPPKVDKRTPTTDRAGPDGRPNENSPTNPYEEREPFQGEDLIIENPPIEEPTKERPHLKLDNQRLNITSSHNNDNSIRGVWLTHHAYESMSDAKVRRVAKDLAKASFNTVYITVYATGVPKWNSKAYKAAGGQVEENSRLAFLAQVFQEAGLTAVAWFEYGLALYPRSHPFVTKYPEWLQRDAKNSYQGNETQVFMSPSHPEVRNLLKQMLVELVTEFQFNEIQLDRFRYTRASSEGREFGYEKVSKDRYKTQTVKEAPSNKNDPNWVAFREGEVNNLVKECYEAIKAANPNMLVSNAPVGDYGIAQHLQRWSDWLKGGYIDYLALQVYNTDINGFKAHLDRHNKILADNGLSGKKSQIAVGIRAKEKTDSEQTAQSLAYANQLGFYNSVLWAYHFYDPKQVSIKDDVQLLRKRIRGIAPDIVWSDKPSHPFIRTK